MKIWPFQSRAPASCGLGFKVLGHPAFPYARHPEELEPCILYILTSFNFFCKDVEELDADLAMQVMKIAIIGDGRATIVVEGTKILQGIDVARSCALLMGVIYALNLSYPKQLKFTFEAFQKLCLELDGQKASSKVMNLKYGIF